MVFHRRYAIIFIDNEEESVMNQNNELTEYQKGKISVAELLYLLYFTVMFGARAIGLFEGMLIYNISLVIGMLLFAVKVMMTEHTLLEYLVMGSMLLLSLLVYYNTGEKGLLLYFTMMLGMKCVSLRRVFKLATVVLSVSFTVLVFLSVTGLKEDIIYIKERAGFGNVIRHSLWYPYPNTLFTTYIILMVLIMYMLGKQTTKNLLLSSLFLFIGAVYIFIYSCSNTGLIVSVFYLLANLYLQLRPKLSKLEKTGIFLVYPVCLIFSIAGPLITKGSLFALFDKVLHNRWAYSLYYLTNEPITLFGVRFGETPNDNYMIDSSFLYSFLQIGVVACVIITLLNLGMILEYVRKEKKIELAIIVSFCVLGLSDPFLYNLSYKNLLFLFIGALFYEKLQEAQTKELGMFNRKIRWFSVGKKELVLQNGLYRSICQKCKAAGTKITKNSLVVSGIYLLSMAVITGGVYLASWAGYIVDKVDQVDEWEYVRGGLSLGVFIGAAVTGMILFVMKRPGTKADKRSE